MTLKWVKSHLFLSLFLFVGPLCAADEDKQHSHDRTDSGYTINYNTVSVVEYIRFASKICKVNFIYDEKDLPFTVSVISDAPITAENVMATLVQVLRINGMMLLEQDNNLVIHKSPDVRQIATIVTESDKSKKAPIVTRIFRVKNAKAESIAAIVRPMISSEALLETSPETRQLIITDVTANVDKVASLIEILDSPHTPLDIKSYEALNNSPDFIIEIANQIMTPIAQGNPFILVPQPLANSIFIVSTPELVDRAISFMKSIDTPPKKGVLTQRKLRAENIFVYKAENRPATSIIEGLNNIADTLGKSGISEGDLLDTIESARYVAHANSIMFVGSPESIAKVKEFLTSLDVANGEENLKASFFVYKAQNRSAEEIEKSILEMATNLKKGKGADSNLIDALESVKLNPLTNTLTFSGEERTFPRIRELIATSDTPGGKSSRPPSKNTFFVYKIQQAPAPQIEASLKDFAKNLDQSNASDEGLGDAINSMKYIQDTNSILFTGSEPALKRLQELVPSFDSGAVPASSQFFIYKPKHLKGEQLSQSIKDTTENLKSDQLADPAFLRTLESMKWVKSNNTMMFTGNASSLKKLEGLIETLDVPAAQKPSEKTFFLYHPEYASRERTEVYLKQISDNLQKKGEDELIDTIRSMKWIEPSQSFMFYGTASSIARTKELLHNFDTPAEKTTKEKSSYYIYKLQHTSGDIIEEDLDTIARNFKTTDLKDIRLVSVIDNMRYVKETNSLLLTGDPVAIEEVKKLIAENDYPRTESAGAINSNFLMYKPQHLAAAQIEKSLKDVAANLKKADLADGSLLKAIDSVKYVETTNSLIFTGPPEALQKVQTLIKDIDIPPQKHAPIQHIGKTTFLLYKLKNAGGSQVVTSIKAMTADLKKSGNSDKDFLAALQSVKYVKDTNSLLFTGTEEALKKVETFVSEFDVSALAPAREKIEPSLTGPSNFFIYKPVSLSGPELEKIMQDFAEHLRLGGLADPDLFNAINSMRFVDKTQTLVFTGSTKAIAQVKELLTSFDIPSNLPQGTLPTSGEPSIQSIDNTSFLVYKLQFHKGDEIQGALRQIAKDLILSNAPVNQNLLNSINSIQWLEVTNSLLCSGDQETLTRLRELVKNLDIPLKQVFIEMLVIETNLTNALTFGLEWGGKYKYRNKFGGTVNNIAGNPSSQNFSTDPQMTYLNQLIPSATTGVVPTGTNMPFGSGFDLGVIGQIIKHNGQTFLTMGSLLQALQTDSETSIIVTPKIITQDGKTSTIFVGQNIPFVGSFVQNQSQNTVQTTNIEYRDIGLNLTVTPVLGNSDIVTLDINLDRTQTATDVTGSTLTTNNNNLTGIVTSRTSMQTTVHVPDKNFLILSGFVNNSNNKTTQGIPCLGGLPIIGAAFSQDNDTVSNSNIVIFLRPHIINSVDDMHRVTTEQEEAFHDQQGTPFLERHFDEGMELIKTVDDE